MRPLGDSPPRSFEFEVLDGNDVPHSWVGREVGVKSVTASGLIVGWLQNKSAWRLVVVENQTGEPWCVPWVAVEAIFLLEEPDGPMTHREASRGARPDHTERFHRRGAPAAYKRILRGPVMVVAVLWLGGLTLLSLFVFALFYVVG